MRSTTVVSGIFFGFALLHPIGAQTPDQFIFIDADLNMQRPGNAAPGSVTPSGRRK
jgi:hypothetical protein